MWPSRFPWTVRRWAAPLSDSEGIWQVPIPGAGTYAVSLDQGTLPAGSGITDPPRWSSLKSKSWRVNRRR